MVLKKQDLWACGTAVSFFTCHFSTKLRFPQVSILEPSELPRVGWDCEELPALLEELACFDWPPVWRGELR